MKKELLLSVSAGACMLPTVAQESHKEILHKDYNVIYILADDLGYGDLACYGQQKILTPNIDRLAKEGMLFTQHYAGCTVSAPSRSALMTGLHTGHTPIRGNKGGVSEDINDEGQHPLPAGTYTLGTLFQQAGYATGCFGKWGLGSPGSEGDPTKQGFDEFYGYNCQALAHKYYPTHLWHNRERVELTGNDFVHKVQYSHDLIQTQTEEFIRKNSDGKFFLMMTYTLPHAELLVPEDSIIQYYRGRFDERPYVAKDGGDYSEEGKHKFKYCSQKEPYAQFAAMVSRMDMYVGKVMNLVDSLGIRDQTIIIFTSDNGPHREGGANPDYFKSYGPYRGIKRDLYEGGIRIPMIASCPGTIEQGSVNGHISAFWDMMPTFAQLIDVNLPCPTDGISFLPSLLGKRSQKKHAYLYWEFHEDGGKMAVRMGKWKAVRLSVGRNPEAPIELYDLERDPHEDHNIASDNQAIVRKMGKIMRKSHTPSPLFNFGQSNGAM